MPTSKNKKQFDIIVRNELNIILTCISFGDVGNAQAYIFQRRFFMRKDAWTHEKFWQRFNELPDKDLYEVITLPEKLSTKTKFTVKCNKNHMYLVSINTFLNNKTRCRICNQGEPWNYERFSREISNLIDKNDYVISNYDNIRNIYSRFTIQCVKCQHIWESTPSNFINKKRRCYNCKKGQRWSVDRVKREFSYIEDYGKYFIEHVENITNSRSVFTVRCNNNHVWETTPLSFFYNKHRCPTCNESHGERKIALFLEINNINFQREKKFDTCKNVKKLPFDFYLPDYRMLLEFQGLQHFRKMEYSQNEVTNNDKFERTKLTDAIKKQWAIDNGYRFLEIRYNEINNIEEILKKELRL